MKLNNRCVLAVAVGDSHRAQAIKMLGSFFLHANGDWDLVCYSDKAAQTAPWWVEARPVSSLFAGYPALACLSPWDQCEVGRFLAIAECLKEYDEVLYCDNDIYWYGRYPHPLFQLPDSPRRLAARPDLVLSPHYLDPAVAAAHRDILRKDGIYNIGIMHFLGKGSAIVCDTMVGAVLADPKANRHKGRLWLQNLLNPVAYWGLAVSTISDPGCNVGYWNLRTGDREVTGRESDPKVICRGVEHPLVSMHYSGKSLAHLLGGEFGPVVQKLAKDYTA